MKECSYEDCVNKPVSHGLCDAHRKQAERGRELTPIRQKGIRCAFEGCDREHYARSYCMSHYKQEQRGVEPRVIRRWVRKQTNKEEE
jgi:hypothetical protein